MSKICLKYVWNMSETYQNDIRKNQKNMKNQKEAPTASGIGGSDAPWPVVLDSRPEIAVRVEKVGFVTDLLFHKNFGHNVVFETLDLW